jgi:rhomboid protease GluP
MNEIRIDDKEVIVMNLVHYFVTEKNYNPVVVHGINDEIWLENMDSDYKIVRIVSRYIHNDEQLGFNRFRSNQITRKLRIKTLSFKMNVLSIYTDLGENVKTLDKDKEGNLSLFVKNLQDFRDNKMLLEVFPDIVEKTQHDEKGIELLFKITDDINQTNERKNKKMEKIFSSKKPIVTYALIVLCVIMFIVSGFGYSTEALLLFGANYGPLVKSGEIYRLITCMFLHGGIIHLGLNMYSLFVIGPRVEDFFGKWKFLLIYFISGISASLLSIGLNVNVISVGASGAIFGLFGALLYFGYSYRGYIGALVRSQIVPIVLYNLIMGFFIPGIDMWGHVGGLIGGIITANMLGTIENKKYNSMNILLFIIYFAFLIYLGIFR